MVTAKTNPKTKLAQARNTKPVQPRITRKAKGADCDAIGDIVQPTLATDEFASVEAFLRDLPRLVADKAIKNRWVLYIGNDQDKVGDTKRELIRQCNTRGLSPNQYFIGYVDENAAADFRSVEIESVSEQVESPNFAARGIEE